VDSHLFHVHLASGVGQNQQATKPRSAARDHTLSVEGKPSIAGSAAPGFHGDSGKWNPEEMFAAALAQCHFLSLVYVADRDGIDIQGVEIDAEAKLELSAEGGRISEVILRPRTTVGPKVDESVVIAAHEEAHELCFIARSVACEVRVEPYVISGSTRDTQL
jgi:organic hydroperoxide reductase OsmC/OhrA